MILKIEKGSDNKILRAPCKDVKEFTKTTAALIKDMKLTQVAAQGVGIAANQVGLNDRLAIITVGVKKMIPIINPYILEYSEETNVAEEGCLSLPGKWAPVRRSNEVALKYQDAHGKEIVMRFIGFEARIVQHEVDHLNGKLFIDRVAATDLHLVAGNKQKDFE